ncbi:type II toxin-antitoxin system MqsA family antitoxin [Methylovorus glucosotrophus]|uniref:type II toxin-antitoxin system MqsA family antitoxin n=1 Tax=Methylovorus glucosotrophus TaxID=266009 RepID=UPI0013318CD3
MKCPICGQAELASDTRDTPYIYKGQKNTIQNVTGGFCPACNESVLNADESRRVMDLMLDLNKEVNSSLVSISGALEPTA